MKKGAAPGYCRFQISLAVTLIASMASAQEYSDLWGVSGEAWNPTNSVLRDFTDVGYMHGDVAIPDWPVGVVVTNFGAVADDGIDDSQAFIDAIAACPSNHAVFVPNGRYQITDQIRVDRDYVVVRGEDMYQTVLFFPKNMGERYPQADYGEALAKGAFFHVDDGTHRSIENLTMEFREQTKMGHWEWRGAYAMRYEGDVVDSWIRNIYFKNVDEGIQFGNAERISVINVIFDQYIGRYDFIGSSGITRWVGHAAIRMTAKRCLMHNIEIKGKYFHPFDIINVPSYCVASSVQGTDMMFNNHGQGANHNLYTEVHAGNGAAIGLSQYQHFETFWNVDADIPIDPARFTNSLDNGHVMVGLNADYPTTITSNFYYEAIDPSALTPSNLYLAQMAYRGKPLPEGPPPPPPLPPELTGDVRILNPTDDNDVGGNPLSGSISFGAYLKFDLSGLQDLSSIAHARLRVCTKARKAGTAFNLSVASVDDDSWTQDTLTNSLVVGSVLDSVAVNDTTIHKWFEFDVTPFVQAEWGGDKTVSLKLSADQTGAYLGALHSREDGNAPQLVIERIADPVPGPPAAPTGVETISSNGYIVLNWDDAPESDFAAYNVYRLPDPNASHPIAQGLVISDFADISDQENRTICEMSSNTVFRYSVTAVDDRGYESARAEFFGTTLHPSNDPPAFSAGPHSLTNAMAKEAYSGNLAGMASDPESDQLYFFKVSGPSWLHVAADGTLSGTPLLSDAGAGQLTVQVNSIGGRDQTVLGITVDTPADDPPGAPAAPVGVAATAGNNSVSLNWIGNTEADLYAYNIYRSTNSGSYGSAFATGVGTNAYVDSTATNGTTYYYVVTAVDSNENESDASAEVSATPAGTLLAAPTGLSAAAGDGSVALDWNDNTEEALAGYNVYRATNSGGYSSPLVTNLASSAHIDNTSSNGITYYYIVTAVSTNGSESSASGEVSATPEEGLITYTAFVGDEVSGAANNWISTAENWDNGLPVGRQGTISINAEYDSSVSHDGYSVRHIGGAVSRSANVAGFKLGAGSVWIMDGVSAAFSSTRGLVMSDALFTLNQGIANLTDNNRDTSVSGSSAGLIINGGSMSVGRNLILNNSANFTMNGGTLSVTGSFYTQNFVSSAGGITFNGGTTTANGLDFDKSATLTFGGTAEGSLTVATTYRDLSAATVSFDWMTGTRMELTISGEDEWAAVEWVAGNLTYNGAGFSTLGDWAAVTAEDGLEAGVRFYYDSDTETLSLASDAALSGYELWAAGWSTNIGAATIDFDLDGLNNLSEYGLDGNPTNELDQGTLPVFSKSGSGFLYVHPKRSDDTNLIYRVETTTNLISGIWTNEGYTVTGTNVTGETLDFVTNEVDAVENEKFIRLKIE